MLGTALDGGSVAVIHRRGSRLHGNDSASCQAVGSPAPLADSETPAARPPCTGRNRAVRGPTRSVTSLSPTSRQVSAHCVFPKHRP